MSTTAPELEEAVLSIPDESLVGEAARYLIASMAALALDAGLLFVGVRFLAIAPWLAGTVAYGAGLIFIYGLATRWVFANRVVREPSQEFLVFALLGVVGLVLNSLTLFVATTIGLALPFAKVLSAGLGFVANFITRKVFLFASGKP